MPEFLPEPYEYKGGCIRVDVADGSIHHPDGAVTTLPRTQIWANGTRSTKDVLTSRLDAAEVGAYYMHLVDDGDGDRCATLYEKKADGWIFVATAQDDEPLEHHWPHDAVKCPVHVAVEISKAWSS